VAAGLVADGLVAAGHPHVQWLSDPGVLAPLALFAGIYVWRFLQVRREAAARGRPPSGAGPLQALAFAGGMLALLAALVSPIDPIAEVRKAVDEFENVDGLPSPLIYADAVIGCNQDRIGKAGCLEVEEAGGRGSDQDQLAGMAVGAAPVLVRLDGRDALVPSAVSALYLRKG
jgi:hypothetical protein